MINEKIIRDSFLECKDMGCICVKEKELCWCKYNQAVKRVLEEKQKEQDEKIQNTQRRLKEVIQMEWDKGMEYILTELKEIFEQEFGEKLTQSDTENNVHFIKNSDLIDVAKKIKASEIDIKTKEGGN